jgi:hypothetical protein
MTQQNSRLQLLWQSCLWFLGSGFVLALIASFGNILGFGLAVTVLLMILIPIQVGYWGKTGWILRDLSIIILTLGLMILLFTVFFGVYCVIGKTFSANLPCEVRYWNGFLVIGIGLGTLSAVLQVISLWRFIRGK